MDISQRIKGTGIFVFSYNPEAKLFTYSRPFNTNEAKSLANEVSKIIASQYKNVCGLRGGLAVNENTGELINMSTLKGIVTNRILMRNTDSQKWFPTIKEGIELQKQGMLPSGILIDFGIALYSDKGPGKEIAQALSETAKKENYAMPVLASFKSLELEKGGKRYGVTPQLISSDGIVFGTIAENLLVENSFYKANSGVRGLYRGRYGDWYAYWGDNLDYCDEYCRVGRISGEASAKKLEDEVLGVFAPIRKSLDEVLANAS